MEQKHDINFIKLNNWSMIPDPNKIDKPSLQHSSDLRWIKNERIKGLCRPYILANTLGWVIKSPLDLNVEPVTELQVECSPEELEEIGNMTSIDFWVKRGSVYIGIKPDAWFRIHQSKIGDNWQNLIIPNGEGSFEWRLGWGLQIPDDYVAMIIPLYDKNEGIKIEAGILESKTLHKFNESYLGISLAFSPLKSAKIKKGEPIANLIVFPKSVLSLKVGIQDWTGE